MRTYRSNPIQSNSSHFQPESPSPFSAKMCGPAETLLVVDDDPMIRELEAQILRLQGYTVLQAASAAEAMRLASQAAPIHLLVTDFLMPEVDGLELTRRFRAVRPKTPVLMVLGSLPMTIDKTQDLDAFECLPKPFAIRDLLDKVRILLDAASPLPLRKPPFSE
jgi:two-component system cell cycle sensor histidine kinase/response regulator CckA